METKVIQQKVEVEVPEGLDIKEVIENAFAFLGTENIGTNTTCRITFEGGNKYIIHIYSTHPICFSCCKQYLNLKLKSLKAKLNWLTLEVK